MILQGIIVNTVSGILIIMLSSIFIINRIEKYNIEVGIKKDFCELSEIAEEIVQLRYDMSTQAQVRGKKAILTDPNYVKRLNELNHKFIRKTRKLRFIYAKSHINNKEVEDIIRYIFSLDIDITKMSSDEKTTDYIIKNATIIAEIFTKHINDNQLEINKKKSFLRFLNKC